MAVYIPPTFRAPTRTAALAAPVAAPKTPAPSPYSGRYTLDMDPGVVAALYMEKAGLADIAATPGPSGGGGYDGGADLANAAEDRRIGLQRLAYNYDLNVGNITHQNVIQGRNIINSLAGRNMLRSGERGYMKGEQARAYQAALQAELTKKTWGGEDLDRQVARTQAAVASARASANAAYSAAVADYQRGVLHDKRELHNTVIQAYVDAYNRVISDPALYTGAGNIDPRTFLSQIPA